MPIFEKRTMDNTKIISRTATTKLHHKAPVKVTIAAVRDLRRRHFVGERQSKNHASCSEALCR
jgi:hypothetical protein